MNARHVRRAIFLGALAVCHFSVAYAEDAQPHPLEVHMHHWISGSGQWRAPNPSYQPGSTPRTREWVREFGVNWRWGPNRQHLLGEIVAIPEDGDPMITGVLYAFYNPVTEKVVEIQVARNGILQFSEDRARKEPTPYGAPEIGDSLEYFPNGGVSILRHVNRFLDANTQLSVSQKRNEEGQWSDQNEWRWTQEP